MVPYFSRAYEHFYLLTSADESHVYGFAGLRCLDAGDMRLAYIGAVVVEPSMRGGNKLYLPIVRALIMEKLRHPRKKLTIFGGIVNPYAYAAFARRTNWILPSPKSQNIPIELRSKVINAMQVLYGFDDTQINIEKGTVLPNISLEPLQEKPLDENNPFLTFFAQRNPHFREGVALLYVVPLTLNALCQTFARFTLHTRRPEYNPKTFERSFLGPVGASVQR